ncbi:DUF418 domain-containing protein [Kineococcus sp. TRM81007]|uniref:DUF418 domain-containing protein n=1 Tax=Kineococcus sp. TRM81007 TaxID=2925831 RepID=UPI001F576D0A|nr:DUF418 domain-containing protein [Kineococcus sp. TRM81007]MCI2238015.1 DUF418 domain-containing protein [Kineococcus sp. TRM81007]
MHTTPGAVPVPAPRGTVLSERVPGPDLARGALLLFICLANVHFLLHSRATGVRGYPAAETLSALDRVVTVLQTSFVDARSFPMFSMLVGYGTWQLVRCRVRDGAPRRSVRRLLRRRGWALLLIGALHGILLFPADIAATYGLLLVLLAAVLAAPGTRALVVLAVTGTFLVAAAGLAEGLPEAGAPLISPGEESPLSALLFRTGEWVFVTVAQPLGVLGALALGALAARRGLLDDPARHRRTLLLVAAAGLPAAALGGLPLALVTAGAWDAGTTGTVLAAGLHSLTGYAGGAAYAALAGLVVTRTAARGGALPTPVRWVVALGRRSLSGYLGHSMVFAALLPASTLGLGAELGVAQASALAVVTWVLLLLGAVLLERAGARGPAEVLLRRLTYGRPR